MNQIGSRIYRTSRLTFVVATLAVMTYACVASPASVPSTSPGATSSSVTSFGVVEASASDENSYCGTQNQFVDYAPVTIESLAKSDGSIVLGTVESIQPAVFNTTDGKKPRGFFAPQGNADRQLHGMILTPVVIRPEEWMSGAAEKGNVRGLIEGGTIGCYTLHVDASPVVVARSRYVMYISNDGYDADGKAAKGQRKLMLAWPIDGLGTVQTVDGAMSIDSLRARISAAVGTP